MSAPAGLRSADGITQNSGTSMRLAIPALAALLLSLPATAQEQATLSPTQDNTIYQDLGDRSNGAGDYFFAGNTQSGFARRALVQFDWTQVPANATIIGVSLQLHMSRTIAGEQPVSLHRLLQSWGEGTSNANANEGTGAVATTGDATWTDRFFGQSAWNDEGGTFEAAPSATTPVGSVGFYGWSSAQMIADVQGWVDGSANGYGWILIGATGSATAKRFDSRENPSPGFRPVLTVTYTTGTAIEDTPASAQPFLAQNFPNPFGPRTEMRFSIASATAVTLEVYDLLGRRVAVLVDAWLPAGVHTASFDAGQEPAGIYLARLRVGDVVFTRQMARID